MLDACVLLLGMDLWLECMIDACVLIFGCGFMVRMHD